MNASTRVPWVRISAESAAIVASILLAFAIDAWWANSARQQDEAESLELIGRDLQNARAQLESYVQYANSASASALNAYVALAGPGPYDRNYIRGEMFRVDRRTVRLPRAAYTELLSTGNLRVIGDRDLRDSIVRYYEAVERAEVVIQRNNEAFLDGLLVDIYYGEGLLLPHFRIDTGLDVVNTSSQLINQQLPSDFAHADDPLWQFDPDSKEWRRLRSALLYSAQIHNIGAIQAQQMFAEADRLSAMIDDALAD